MAPAAPILCRSSKGTPITMRDRPVSFAMNAKSAASATVEDVALNVTEAPRSASANPTAKQ